MSERTDFKHPEFLTSTEWLGGHLGEPGICVVDCDVPEQYQRAHIPGAVFQQDHYQKDPDTNRLHIFGPEGFKQLAESLGIGDDTLVVAYDNSRGLYAGRLWWALHHYGHTNVKVMDGGWRKWLSEGRPISDFPAGDPPSVTFTPRLDDSMMVTADQLMEDMNKSDAVVWDVRSRGEYEGTTTRGNRRPGRIAGAVHLEWLELVDGRTHLLKPAAEIRGILEDNGITPDKRIDAH